MYVCVQRAMLKWLAALLLCLIACLLICVAVLVSGATSACAGLQTCDTYKPICASYQGDHQFFYSHCDMVRENCLTGAFWKRDHFSHCNVNSKT